MDKSLTRKIITEGTVMVSSRIQIHSDHIGYVKYEHGDIASSEEFKKMFKSYRQDYSIHIWSSCIKNIVSKLYEDMQYSNVIHPFHTVLSAYYTLLAYDDNINASYIMNDDGDMTLTLRVILIYNEELNRVEVKPIKKN